MGRFPARLLLLALTGKAREILELVPAVQGSPFSTNCYYNNDKYSPKEKFWCKMLSDRECNSRIFLSIQAKGEKYLNIAPKRRVHLTNSGTGWISVSMTELRIEDSGTYLCGVFDHQTIIPLKMIKVAVSYDGELSAKKGGSISLNCSYFVMDNSRRPNNFTWCKMITATRCEPVVSVKFDQIVNTQGRTRIKIDRWNRVIIVTLVALQLHDTGKYHCETHLQGSTMLLKMITLNVLGELLKENYPSLKSQILYVVLALGSFLVGSALIAIVAIIFTIGRKRGNGNVKKDDFRFILLLFVAFQKDEEHSRDATPDAELKNGIIYAMLRLPPKPKPDDVTYDNVELPQKPKGAKHSAVLFSSGTMEYATIIFGDSPPRSETKEKQCP
uniref:Ig-like domain-containing protein n=1 Tax=Gopherus agassizii TaxID=38772 RepID=A0A452HFF9_9SAUR